MAGGFCSGSDAFPMKLKLVRDTGHLEGFTSPEEGRWAAGPLVPLQASQSLCRGPGGKAAQVTPSAVRADHLRGPGTSCWAQPSLCQPRPPHLLLGQEAAREGALPRQGPCRAGLPTGSGGLSAGNETVNTPAAEGRSSA